MAALPQYPPRQSSVIVPGSCCTHVEVLPVAALVEADQAHLLVRVERAVLEDRRNVDAAHAVDAVHVRETLVRRVPKSGHTTASPKRKVSTLIQTEKSKLCWLLETVNYFSADWGGST